MRRRVTYTRSGLRELMLKLGIIPPDTEFNRRAAAYAKHAQDLAWARETATRQRAAKKTEKPK